jgi:imidazolonepropionase-like amidohydrolase
MTIVLHGATVLAGANLEPIDDSVVIIEKDRIEAVGRRSDFGELPNGEKTIVQDVTGMWVMPGIINCHEHITFKRYQGAFQELEHRPTSWFVGHGIGACMVSLREGVTTVRDVGAPRDLNIHIRDLVKTGEVIGPRIVASGTPLSITGGHGFEIGLEVDGVEQCRKAARQQLKAGADWLKVMASGGFVAQGSDLPHHPQLGVEELRVIADEAHRVDRKVTAHCHPPNAIRMCLEAGIDCIEHAALIDKPTADLMAERGTYLVPTLSALGVTARRGAAMGRPQWLVDISAAHAQQLVDAFSIAYDAGVPIAAGCDSIGEMALELELMVQGGMTPSEALQAATSVAASLLGLEDVGSIVAGNVADLIVLTDDPTKDVAATRAIETVFAGGRRLHRETLMTVAGDAVTYDSYLEAPVAA